MEVSIISADHNRKKPLYLLPWLPESQTSIMVFTSFGLMFIYTSYQKLATKIPGSATAYLKKFYILPNSLSTCSPRICCYVGYYIVIRNGQSSSSDICYITAI